MTPTESRILRYSITCLVIIAIVVQALRAPYQVGGWCAIVLMAACSWYLHRTFRSLYEGKGS